VIAPITNKPHKLQPKSKLGTSRASFQLAVKFWDIGNSTSAKLVAIVHQIWKKLGIWALGIGHRAFTGSEAKPGSHIKSKLATFPSLPFLKKIYPSQIAAIGKKTARLPYRKH
jgi:hypothetical protein